MNFRNEWKHEITPADRMVLKQRLSIVMKPDSHAQDGTYYIRSLYFDDLKDTALYEKIDGVNKRDKYRLRFYNGDTSYIVLERKSKINGLCQKKSVRISEHDAALLSENRIISVSELECPEARQLYAEMKSKGLRPKTIVDYTRIPFTYGPGNVRVTIDYDIRCGVLTTNFLNPDCITVPVPGSLIILEVKWDAFLPELIRDAVGLPSRRAAAFSKYAACRAYDN